MHLEKRTICRGLALLVLLALVWQCGTPLAAHSHEVWAESLVPGPRRRYSRRYDRYRQACWGFWMRRVQVLLWSGCAQRQPASWALLSVPVVDAGLPLLAVTWPRLAQSRGYRHGVGAASTVSGRSGVAVGSGTDHRAAGLLLVDGTVKTADGAPAQGRIDEAGTWR